MIEIKNLRASVQGEAILKGLNLNIQAGEVHCIMGPNGSGKSTLAQVLAGRDTYEITAGSVSFKGQDLLEMAPHERACEGLFLAFQYPHEIPGVSGLQFLRASVNAVRKHRGQEELDAFDMMQQLKKAAAEVNIPFDELKRSVNEGFSGGEKKRNEMLQMALLEPCFVVLDEVDSGLDIDALKVVSDAVNRMRTPDRAFLLITHYQRLLNYIVPDKVHVLVDGRIAKSGGKELALELEDKGYAWVASHAAAE
ncbi:MAG: Fe-S cluster assembly ATPase SufC [Acidobacteria bacterium]|nr:Fe-S cluster assembly ATPase SufC [Acidobacteriota bacterium]